MNDGFIPLPLFEKRSPAEMLRRSKTFYAEMSRRRSVRHFSEAEISMGVIEQCLLTAGSSPSGANQQPWHFVIVRDKAVKQQIRAAAEEEEREFYAGRAGDVWLETLEPLGTNSEKPFLEKAPILIAIFEQKYHLNEQGNKVKHYYSRESTGIATGVLITALHHAGLVSLTHTPSPMNFLKTILGRPESERPFLLLVVGYPAENVKVPNIRKKPLDEISTKL